MKSFLPATLDVDDWARVEPVYRALLGREARSDEEFAAFVRDFSALTEWVNEEGTRRYIAHTCHTDDEDAKRRYLRFVQEVQPRVAPLVFELQRKFLRLCAGRDLSPALAQVRRHWEWEVEIYRERNVPLLAQLATLHSEYQQLCGAMTVEVRGRTLTMQQAAALLEDPDRSLRQEAWEKSVERRLRDRGAIDALFDKMLLLNEQVARNADEPDFRAYTWKSRGRFDYTPGDCDAYARTVRALVLPMVARINEQRRAALGLERLRPWDLAVDPLGRPPLRPFPAHEVARLVSGTRSMFASLSPHWAAQFELLQERTHLDLASRAGKAPGGYQASLDRARQPFIFMNAVGTHADLRTMLHEAGHALHYLACRDVEPVFARGAPLEFCEVASMAMELIGHDHLEPFYPDPAERRRAQRQQLEGVLQVLPWIAVIDQFQHELYAGPTTRPVTAAGRQALWLDVLQRYSDPAVDWTGYDDARAAMWQRQGHLFGSPFYYIEYGLAQLGALRVWMNVRQDVASGLGQLRSALALGGSASLPDLFRTAGAAWDFSQATLDPLLARVRQELESL